MTWSLSLYTRGRPNFVLIYHNSFFLHDIQKHIYRHTQIYIHIYTYTYTYIYIYIYIQIYTHTHTMYIHTIHKHIHMHVHMHAHIHTQIHTHTNRSCKIRCDFYEPHLSYRGQQIPSLLVYKSIYPICDTNFDLKFKVKVFKHTCTHHLLMNNWAV
jgi:hypothetical protein